MGEFCVDCRHHFMRPSGAHECLNPIYKRPVNLVTGESEPAWCEALRTLGNKCGETAKGFEPKEGA